MLVPPEARDVVDKAFVAAVTNVTAATMGHVRARIATLPEPARSGLAKVLKNYKAVQMATSVGQKVALSVAYDLGLRDVAGLTLVNNASTFGSLHSLLLDDLVDNAANPVVCPVSNAYLAHLLFIFYLDDIRQICPTSWDEHGYPAFLGSEFETYSALYEEEVEHVGAATAFSSRSLIARKCSPVKAIMRQVLLRVGRLELAGALDGIIEDASVAMCTLDDVIDWEEDLDRRRYTYPIQVVLDELSIVDPGAIPVDELRVRVLRHLSFEPVYHRLMKEILDSLQDCGRRASEISPKLRVWFEISAGQVETSWRDHVAFLLDLDRRPPRRA